MIHSLYGWVVRHRNQIVLLFHIVAVVQVAALAAGYWFIVVADKFTVDLYVFGRLAGKWAVVSYILTIIPGIWRRIGRFNKLVSILMIFRRYIGITMYLFAIIHSSFIRSFPYFAREGSLFVPDFSGSTSEFFGFWALILLFFLFVTSNDLSTKRLGDWWAKVHSFTYVVIWFVFLHVMLQRLSIWSIMLGIALVAQVASFIIARARRAH